MLKGWLSSSILGLIFAILIVIFALQNTMTTTVTLIIYSIPNVSVALLILICVLLGVICTGFVAVAEQRKSAKKISTLEKKIKDYEPAFKE